MPYFKSQSQYWAVFVCLIVIAFVSRLQQNSQFNDGYNYNQSNQRQSREVSQKQIKGAVSGMIGIDETRGDTVYVYTK